MRRHGHQRVPADVLCGDMEQGRCRDLIERVPTTMTLSESGDEFTEHGHWDFLDLNSTVRFRSSADDIKATRLETDQD